MVLRALFSKFKTSPSAPTPPSERSICFVSATRSTESEFWESSALGTSLKPLLERPGISARIAFENRRGLSAVYNESIRADDAADILVFLHDDVWFYDDHLLEKIRSGHEAFDVFGVVGNKRRLPRQPAWMFRSLTDGHLIPDRANLSGLVANGNPDEFFIDDFGPTPAECELVDGLLISTLRHRLVSTGTCFDEQFEFHFYDVDFCRTVRANALTMGTWPLQVIHQSPGAFGEDSWYAALNQYLAKWKS